MDASVILSMKPEALSNANNCLNNPAALLLYISQRNLHTDTPGNLHKDFLHSLVASRGIEGNLSVHC